MGRPAVRAPLAGGAPSLLRLAHADANGVGEVGGRAPDAEDVGARVDPPAARRAALLVGPDQRGGLGPGEQGLPGRVARIPAGEGAIAQLEPDGGALAGAEVHL